MVDLDEAGAGKLGAVTLTDDAGNPTAEITGIYVRRVERRALPLPLEQKVFDTAWVPSPAAAGHAASAAPGSWLVLADETDAKVMADEFAGQWRCAARRVLTANLADESAVRAAFADTAADAERPPVGVVIFVGDGSPDLTEALTRARESIWSISSTIRAVVGGWHGRSPRLWLVTRQGLVVHGDEPGDPATGALKGLVRVLAYEHPDLRATLVDLDSGEGAIAALTTELGATDHDDVDRLAVRPEVRPTAVPGCPGFHRARPGGPRRCGVHRHRRPGWTRSGRRPMARRQRCGPRRAERPQRAFR